MFSLCAPFVKQCSQEKIGHLCMHRNALQSIVFWTKINMPAHLVWARWPSHTVMENDCTHCVIRLQASPDHWYGTNWAWCKYQRHHVWCFHALQYRLVRLHVYAKFMFEFELCQSFSHVPILYQQLCSVTVQRQNRRWVSVQMLISVIGWECTVHRQLTCTSIVYHSHYCPAVMMVGVLGSLCTAFGTCTHVYIYGV